MVGGWWEGSVWLVEREVLGWWGGTEEGAAGGKGWTLSIPIYSASFYPFQKPAVLSIFIAWPSLQTLKLRAAFTVAWMPMKNLAPACILLIILAAILSAVSHFSETLTRYLANQLIPLMATVLLLSYVKFFRVMLTAFSVTQLMN